MNREDAIRYVRDQLMAGMGQDRLIEEMVRLGWSREDTLRFIEVARSTALSGVSPAPLNPVQAPVAQVLEKGKKKILVMAGIIALAFCLVGGGVYAYFQLTVPSPEDVLHRMMQNNSSVESFSVAVEGKAQSSSLNSKMNVNVSGDVDMRDKNNPKYLVRIKGDGGSGVSLVVVDGEIIYRDKIAYLKVNPGTSFGPFSLNMISNQWFKIDPQNDLASSSPVSGFGVNIPNNKLSVTPEQTAKIKDMVKNAYFFKDVTTLPSEDVGEIGTYHYGFKPDAAALMDFTKNVGGILNVSSIAESILPSEVDAMQQSFASTTWEIWVDKKDYLLRKLLVRRDDSSASMAFTLLMSNYNAVLEIPMPSDTKPIQEVLQSLFGGTPEIQQPPAR